jgi:formylglycine-generating enzyme required for sulfatase activity
MIRCCPSPAPLLFALAFGGVFPACGGRPATPLATLPQPELTPAAKERLARHALPTTWEDLDPAHPGRRLRDPRLGIVFVRVPAGEFLMGNDDIAIEKPKHRVRLSRDFLLAETEVTIGQWQAYARDFAGDPNVPVRGKSADHPMPLSCLDAITFCERLGYRLPTEAEWERACTGGLPREQEPWSTEAGMREHAWFHRNAEMQAHPVRTRAANAFGLHDMLGNLWEWCGEDWNPVAYAGRGELTIDPRRPSTTFDHVLRGGSWFSVPPAMPRTRSSGGFAERNEFFGCRPARDLPQ